MDEPLLPLSLPTETNVCLARAPSEDCPQESVSSAQGDLFATDYPEAGDICTFG